MKFEIYEHSIPGNAPERLRGKTIKAILSEGRISFVIEDFPEEPTAQEKGYFKWFTGEVMDSIVKSTEGISVSASEMSNKLTPEEEKALGRE